MPKFHHRFTPARGSVLGDSVDLATRQIEDAGILEVLQTPGAALGTWAVFDALLVPGHEWFVFHSPLGQSREVKTALSGLFGRFVARAYATHHLGFSHFQTIHSPPMQLTGAGGYVRRSRGHPSGDLPDWAAWGPSGQLAIIEAKGCNAASGLGTVLAKAYEQSKRASITVGRRNATFKRYAIATRWGVDTLGSDPKLWVQDPPVKGTTTPDEQAALGVGLVRRHYASLMNGLGLFELAEALSDLAGAAPEDQVVAQQRAGQVLNDAPRRRVDAEQRSQPIEAVVGAYVTRGGRLPADEVLTMDDHRVLTKLKLRPALVGVEQITLKAAIAGDLEGLNARLPAAIESAAPERAPSLDRSGVWISRLDEDLVRIEGD